MMKRGIHTTCEQDPEVWHPWFAWYPVQLGRTVWKDGRICKTTAWLVHVERSGTPYYGWSYRAVIT
jgi:hypothetical protein